jgi:metallophosphoesterase (TIGR00282 family)
MNILFIGDVFGTKGQAALEKYLPKMKQEYRPDMIFVNGENIDKGFGITMKTYKFLMEQGVRLVTLGNHSFSKRELLEFIDDANIIRPANYHKDVPGKGMQILRFNDQTVAVVNLMGRIFMGDPLDNPFQRIDELLEEIEADYIIVDFHAEATSEKLAFGHYVDGRVDAVVGTHTHVPTADAMVLPKNTLYITDIGMTGSKYGILGGEKESIINKFITGMPSRIKEETSKQLQFNAVFLDLDNHTIKAINIHE